MICEVGRIARSSYYYSLKASVIEEKDKQLIQDMNELLNEKDRKKGSAYKAKMLSKKYGHPVNHKKMERICHKYGLLSNVKRARHPKEYYKDVQEKEALMPGNILNRDFCATKKTEKIVSDITYFAVKEGWLYLSAAKDLFDKSISAFSCSHNVDAKLALKTLEKFRAKEHTVGAIWHTDLGSTYTSNDYLTEIDLQGWTKSFSNKGQCWDNACMENWFGLLKSEIDYYETLKKNHNLWSYTEAEKIICDYIKYYNEDRLQKSLGWLSPLDYSRLVS